jgi:pentatricopeptide repeat protein
MQIFQLQLDLQMKRLTSNLTKRLGLQEMRQRGFKPDVRTWGLLLTACAQQALHQKIRQLLLDMKRSGCDPDVGCFESLVLAYANGGRVREGLELLRGLWAKGLAVRQSAYVPLLGACAKARDVVSAKVSRLRVHLFQSRLVVESRAFRWPQIL